jgi:protein-disulfide isomerase
MRDSQRRSSSLLTLAAPALLAAALTACGGPGQEAIDELKTQQRQILAKLADIEKKLEGGAPSRASAARGRSGPDPNEVYELPVGKSPTRGPESAPVTIVEFSDYQCPFCARTEPLIKSVLEQYPTQVRFVFKHLPLTSLHPSALPAAQAAVAAQNQGKFWEMHDVLFSKNDGLGTDALKTYAQRIGLDVMRFEADMASPETKAQIQEDMRLSRRLGVRGTPTIFVNGKLLTQRSVEGVKAMIDPILAAKARG